MITRRNGKWHLYPHKIRYTQHDEEITQYALPSKEWWLDFENKWEHTEIIEFIDVELSESQLERFKEIEYMPEDFLDVYVDYILTGETNVDNLPTNHPFRFIYLKKRDDEHSDYLIEVDFRLSMAELEL